MAANSLTRRVIKKLLAPVLSERSYSVFQALAKGWDIRNGTWIEAEVDLIRYAVQPGDTVVDIGANYGMYAYHLIRAVGSSGNVYCFEPIPFTAATFRLVARMLAFTDVHLVEKGCGEKTGRISFAVPVMESGAISAGLVHMGQRDNERSGREQWAQFPKTKQVECDVVAIDEFLPDLTNLSLLKCDIEGADLFAMRGARRTLEKHHPTVIIEINPWFLEGFGLRTADVVGFFASLGYGLYRYEAGRLQPRALEEVVNGNWIFVHPSRRARLAPLLPPEA